MPGAQQAWYMYPRIDGYGSPDPYGGFPKPDSNILCPDGTPVTALLPGTISGINSPTGQCPPWGASITIRLDTPWNSIATHTAFLHLPAISGSVQIGQHINAGDLLGYSGTPQGSQVAALGFALYNGDIYGYGPTWNEYLGNPALDPVPLLNDAKNGTLGLPTGGGVPPGGLGGWNGQITFGGYSFMQGFVNGTNAVHQAISPSASVTTALAEMDVYLMLTNPFEFANGEPTFTIGAPSISIGPVNLPQAGATFPDPVAWLQDVAVNMGENANAFILRTVLFCCGLAILIKVISAVIDFDAIGTAIKNGINPTGISPQEAISMVGAFA